MAANDPLDVLRNPKDPLNNAGPPQGRELFRRFGRVADGFSHEDVIDAAVNLILNSIRQGNAKWPGAEKRFDELFGKSKTTLRQHYDGPGGRRNIFPFDQTVLMDHFDARDGFRNGKH